MTFRCRLGLNAAALIAFGVTLPCAAPAQCQLGGNVQHVIYVQFDNVHFTRDNPNVPSDLEQMPHLLNLIEQNGVLLSNHHTPLIAHTADDIVTSLTGLYPDRQGLAVANSYDYFTPTGPKYTSAFTYWTDPVDAVNDSSYNLIGADGKNTPAPWVPYTRAGCNVGAVSIANMELENVTSDINTVFGPSSPQALEAAANKTQATSDFVGIAIHCAAGNSACSSANGGVADVLPQEPNGYTGFNALFGHKYVAPVISSNGPLTDLSGNPITGFPGFGGISAAQTLAYVAAMQENGVPVTFAYISDAHDNHSAFGAFGPGQAGYVAQLAAYDAAWATFITRMENDGLNFSNTLFVVTSDENDHFAGGSPTSPCDGINTPCTYTLIGEVNINTKSLLTKANADIANHPFDIHFDSAPAFYINGQPQTGDPILREFETTTAQLTAINPITSNQDQLTNYLADKPELSILHMVTGDPLRTPSFVMFGKPDYYFQLSGVDVVESPGYAWNHGTISPDINVTWLGMAGPGVRLGGVDSTTWSDHTDIRPTMLSMVGLKDDYISDGRVLFEELNGATVPPTIFQSGIYYLPLAQIYKQLNAPLGAFAQTTLAASTAALAGTDNNHYSLVEGYLTTLGSQRDALAAQIKQVLNDAEFNNVPVDPFNAYDLYYQAAALINIAGYIH